MKNAITLVASLGFVVFCLQIMDAKTPIHKRTVRNHRPVAGQNIDASQVNIGQESTDDEKFREKYPQLFEQKAVILAFTASWCGPCRTQKIYTKALEGRYHVKTLDIDKEPGKSLYKHFEGKAVPYTVVVVEGKLKKSFEGVTTVSKIEEYAAEARKVQNEDDETDGDRNDRSRLRDWIFWWR